MRLWFNVYDASIEQLKIERRTHTQEWKGRVYNVHRQTILFICCVFNIKRDSDNKMPALIGTNLNSKCVFPYLNALAVHVEQIPFQTPDTIT